MYRLTNYNHILPILKISISNPYQTTIDITDLFQYTICIPNLEVVMLKSPTELLLNRVDNDPFFKVPIQAIPEDSRPTYPKIIKSLLEKVKQIISEYPDRLFMYSWYNKYKGLNCYCIAGWIENLLMMYVNEYMIYDGDANIDVHYLSNAINNGEVEEYINSLSLPSIIAKSTTVNLPKLTFKLFHEYDLDRTFSLRYYLGYSSNSFYSKTRVNIKKTYYSESDFYRYVGMCQLIFIDNWSEDKRESFEYDVSNSYENQANITIEMIDAWLNQYYREEVTT